MNSIDCSLRGLADMIDTIEKEFFVRGNKKMLTEPIVLQPGNENKSPLNFLPLEWKLAPDARVGKLLARLSPDKPWGQRRSAARKLGYMRCREALPVILEVLPADPFWMVRCAMIQALERIGDPQAIPTLQLVAKNDRFQIVRSHAVKTIDRLSQMGVATV